MVPRAITQELRRRRMQLRLSQADLAREIGVSRATIGNIEANLADWEPRSETMVRWALALGLDPADLLRRLGRVPASHLASELPQNAVEELLAAIRREVAEGVREGVAQALTELRGTQLQPRGTGTQPPAAESPAQPS